MTPAFPTSAARGRAVALAAALLAACSPSTNPDGTSASDFIATEVGRIAAVCAAEGFDPAAVRARLIAEGFVEHQRPGILQLERFPAGASALTQGVTTASRTPCSPTVNALFGQESVNAAGTALRSAGFVPTGQPNILARGPQRVRLLGRALAIGGAATIKIEPVS